MLACRADDLRRMLLRAHLTFANSTFSKTICGRQPIIALTPKPKLSFR
ncbi:MAG: hypothetical protein ABI700_09765 [Chloroflexota bacterium]